MKIIKYILLNLTFLFFTFSSFAQSNQVAIAQNEEGIKLLVDGNDFIVNGINWDYFPIGTNYTYSLWEKPDTLIKAALHTEMTLLKDMGVNAVRQYTGVPAKWIQYIYETYGIFTMLNHPLGRYGVALNGNWVSNTEYADSLVREVLLSEVKALAQEYKDTPGLLMYLLGNENNYGLFWDGAETEDIPVEDRKSTIRARSMYQLFNEAAIAMKAIDTSHPVAMCNGDLQFLDIIVEECKEVDIFGTNMYRGISFGDAFERVKKEFNKPLMFTEFGADAYNTIEQREDQEPQAYYMVGNWQEIYENVAGLEGADNCIGGFTFQCSDGWWKFGQTYHLDVHDNNASWSNGGYKNDYIKGQNNMNEEWFGVFAKGPTNEQGTYPLYPRAAYYALQKVHQLNPYTDGVTLEVVQKHFASIQLKEPSVQVKKVKEAKDK